MSHAQKPDFVFQRNGRVHLNGGRGGASVQSTTGSRGMRISGSNAAYTMFRGSVKNTGYQLQSPVSPSFPLPCVIVCHHVSTGLYHPSSVLSQAWPETTQTAETPDRCTKFNMKNGIRSSCFVLRANISGPFFQFSFVSFLTPFLWKLFVSGIQGTYALENPPVVVNAITCGNSGRARI
jgi:hypothetical protein